MLQLSSRLSDHRLCVATTVKQSSLVRVPVVIFIVTMVLLMALSPMVEAGELGPGMKLSFYNNMPRGLQHAVKAHCFDQAGIPGGYTGDRGSFWFEPTHWWDIWINSNDDRIHDYGGRKYSCEFHTLNKPITMVDIFVGTGGGRNLPCDCVDEACQWMISDEGLSCGSV